MAKKKRKPPKPAKKAKKVKKATPWWKDSRIRLILLGLAVVTFLTFIPSLNNDFTNWDDQDYVTDNPHVVNIDAKSINAMFTQQIASNYHPLTILSLAINYQFAVLDAPLYHWTNLLFHVLNTLLVFYFVYLFTGRKWEGALVVALLFGIHPMHVESVAWIAERKDVLYTAFFLGGMIQYLGYLKSKKNKKLIYTGIFFLLSLLSKPTAVTFPVVMVLMDFVKNRKFDSRAIVEKIPFFILSIIFGLITINIQSGSAIGSMEDYTIVQRVMFASYGVYYYIAKLFVPTGLATFHPYPPLNAIPVIFKAAPVFVLILLAAVAYSLRSTKIILFGVAFYLVKIALTLQFVQVGSAIVSERYTYMSYIGLFMIIGALVDFLIKQKDEKYSLPRMAVLGILGLGSVIFALVSFQQCKVWKNSGTLWTNVLKVYPKASVPYNNLGNYQMDEIKKMANPTNDLYNEPLANLSKALELNSKYYKAYIARGQLYRRTGQYELALNDYNTAINLKPEFSDAYNNRGNIYFSINQDENALADYRKVMELNPSDEKAYGNTGAIYARQRKFQESLQMLDRAIGINAGYMDAYLNRGVVHAELGNSDQAIQDFTSNIRLGNVNNAMVYYWRGLQYYKKQRYNESLNDHNKAIQLNPNNPTYYRARADTHQALGNTQAAQQDRAAAGG